MSTETVGAKAINAALARATGWREDWLYRAGWRVKMVNSDMTASAKLLHWKTGENAEACQDNDSLTTAPARRRALAFAAHKALCQPEAR